MAKKKTDEADNTAFELSTETINEPGKPLNKAGQMIFEEWRMERVRKGSDANDKPVFQMQKLKMIRGNVKITQETADTLNAGASSPDAVNPIMYLLPGQDA